MTVLTMRKESTEPVQTNQMLNESTPREIEIKSRRIAQNASSRQFAPDLGANGDQPLATVNHPRGEGDKRAAASSSFCVTHRCKQTMNELSVSELTYRKLR